LKNEKYASRACAPRVPRRIPFVSVVMTGGYVIPAIIHPLNGQVDYETLFTIYDSIHYYPSPSFSFFHLSDRLNMRVLIAFFPLKKIHIIFISEVKQHQYADAFSSFSVLFIKRVSIFYFYFSLEENLIPNCLFFFF
jgi:hypothetical protein